MNTLTNLIYGGGPFYTGGPVINDLKNSGFTTVVAWCIWVRPTGDLYYNDTLIAEGGNYLGSTDWNTQLASLKQGTTSVNRILLSVLGPFANINTLGTAKTGVLYKNFQALHQAVPAIDGIDFDDEDLYDQSTIVNFALMLQAIGYSQVTFCPYTESDTWCQCLAKIDQAAPGFVTGFNLQCYSGGSVNQNLIPDWIASVQKAMGSNFNANGFVYPGLWCIHDTKEGGKCSDGDCPDSVTSKFQGWQSSRLEGGWIYIYDSIQECSSSGACGSGAAIDTAAYANAVIQGLQSSPYPSAAGKPR
jgi:hypothetical protein